MTDMGLRGELLRFGNVDEVYDAFCEKQWTDGLPIVPPTVEKVTRMIEAAGRSPGETLGIMPPRFAEATVENVAINAVMAGCLPAYFPVLLAAVEAACDPAFGLYSIQATTHPCGVLMLLTGPVVEALGLNMGQGAFGPGNRANATLGRAMRLVLINVGGGLPGKGDQSTQGSPGKYSYCIAENEAASPWEPFRIAQGFTASDSTLTIMSAESPHNINDHVATKDTDLLITVADAMATIGHNNACCIGSGDVLVAMGPEHAHTAASGGMSRRDVQQFLFEQARNRIGKIRNRAMWDMFDWPEWVDKTDDDFMVPLVEKPEDILLIVVGGAGKHSAFMPTFGVDKSITRKIEFTAKQGDG